MKAKSAVAATDGASNEENDGDNLYDLSVPTFLQTISLQRIPQPCGDALRGERR
jgi:hypothetical protein